MAIGRIANAAIRDWTRIEDFLVGFEQSGARQRISRRRANQSLGVFQNIDGPAARRDAMDLGDWQLSIRRERSRRADARRPGANRGSGRSAVLGGRRFERVWL